MNCSAAADWNKFPGLVLLIDLPSYHGFAALVDTSLAAIIGYALLAVLFIFFLFVALIPYMPTALGIAGRADLIDLTPTQQAVRRVLASSSPISPSSSKRCTTT